MMSDEQDFRDALVGVVTHKLNIDQCYQVAEFIQQLINGGENPSSNQPSSLPPSPFDAGVQQAMAQQQVLNEEMAQRRDDNRRMRQEVNNLFLQALKQKLSTPQPPST